MALGNDSPHSELSDITGMSDRTIGTAIRRSRSADNETASAIEGKWLAYFRGLRLALDVVEMDEGADKSRGPIVFLGLMLASSTAAFLPLLTAADGNAPFNRSLNSQLSSIGFCAALSLSLGACIPTLVTLLTATAEQWRTGANDAELVYRLTLLRTALVVVHAGTLSAMLALALTASLDSNLYAVLNNVWYSVMWACVMFFSKVHLTRCGGYVEYSGLFAFVLVGTVVVVYGETRPPVDYEAVRSAVVLPYIVAAFVFVHVAYFACISRNLRLAAADRPTPVPVAGCSICPIPTPTAICMLTFIALDAMAILELAVNASIGELRFSDYPFVELAFHPLIKTLLVVLVAVVPVRLSNSRAMRTRSYLTALEMQLDPTASATATAATAPRPDPIGVAPPTLPTAPVDIEAHIRERVLAAHSRPSRVELQALSQTLPGAVAEGFSEPFYPSSSSSTAGSREAV